jgi:hypothetical protein
MNGIFDLSPEVLENIKKLLRDIFQGIGLDKVSQVIVREVNNIEAEKIKKDISIDLTGFKFALTNVEIRHIFIEHGGESTEIPRGQVPIEDKDILSIPYITENYDKIELSYKLSRGRKVIVFEKKIDDDVFYCFCAINGKKTISAITMYKRKMKRL